MTYNGRKFTKEYTQNFHAMAYSDSIQKYRKNKTSFVIELYNVQRQSHECVCKQKVLWGG